MEYAVLVLIMNMLQLALTCLNCDSTVNSFFCCWKLLLFTKYYI